MLSHPYFIKLIHGLFNDFWIICQDASFKVTFVICLHSDTCTCKIRTADIHLFNIKDKHFEMNTGTKHSLQTIIQHCVLVKILTKVRTWFFCMNESNLHTAPYEMSNDGKKRFLFFA